MLAADGRPAHARGWRQAVRRRHEGTGFASEPRGLLDALGKSDPLIRDALEAVLERGDFIRALPHEGAAGAPVAAPAGGTSAPIETVQQVNFIEQAQSLGLTLDDVHQPLTGRQRRPTPTSCRKVRDLLTHRIGDIDGRINERRDFRRTLHEHLAARDRPLRVPGIRSVLSWMRWPDRKGVSKRYEAH